MANVYEHTLLPCIHQALVTVRTNTFLHTAAGPEVDRAH